MSYTLWNEECLEAMKRIPDGTVDMVMCDLPYGTTQNKWDSVIDLPSMWNAYRRICKPSGAIVLTAAQPFTSVLVCSNLRDFKYDWVWQKPKATGHLNAKKAPMRAHESVLVFGGAKRYFPQKTASKPYKGKGGSSKRNNYGDFRAEREGSPDGTRYPRSVVDFTHEVSPSHPTQKPVALMEYLIKTYTLPGELVLDNCMGSGTTGVACMNLGRRFIGIEKDTEHGYFQIAERRIREATNIEKEDWV